MPFPPLRLDTTSPVPVYRQLADRIHFAINTGFLRPGETVPSQRAIAAEAGVALNTVVKAFRMLNQAGVIVSTPRRGYQVISNLDRSAKVPHQAPAGDSRASPSGDFPPVELSNDPAADEQEPHQSGKTTGKRNSSSEDRYAQRGVSSGKEEIHAVVDRLPSGLFPGAFCKITEDYLTGDPAKCNVIHADGSGSKSVIAYLHYRETGDASVFRGIAQDSVAMNLDDLLCVGCTGGILLSSTVNRNARRFPGEALAALIEGTEAFLAHLRSLGIIIASGGGETADVGDLTGTVTVDSCAVAVMAKSTVIDGSGIVPGLAIVGLASDGKATYETVENSGIGSNGLTSARHELLKGTYRKRYPETYDPDTPKELVYNGPYRLSDPLPGSPLTVGEALLSPTRTYAPIVRALLAEHPGAVRGLVHCSGGGQTKCLRFGRGIHFIKDRLFEPPAIFRAIQAVAGTKWREMYRVFNCGHRMEVYCPVEEVEAVIEVAARFGVAAKVVGETRPSLDPARRNHLTLHHGKKVLEYDLR